MSDLISRVDTLEVIGKLMEIHFDRKVVLAKAFSQIKDLPSAEPKTGKWIGGELGNCSVCGHKGCASDIWNGYHRDTYCPSCGAHLEV